MGFRIPRNTQVSPHPAGVDTAEEAVLKTTPPPPFPEGKDLCSDHTSPNLNRFELQEEGLWLGMQN